MQRVVAVALLLLILTTPALSYAAPEYPKVKPLSEYGKPRDFKIFSKIFTNISSEGSPKRVRVVVLTKDPNTLKSYMHITYTIGLSNSQLAFGSVDEELLYKLPQLPGVLRVMKDSMLNYDFVEKFGRLPEADLYRVVEVVGAERVEHELGINGSGVVIGIADTGIDFGNPDLSEAVARDAEGKPIQLDPDGQGIVLTNTTFIANIDSSGRILNWTEPLPENISSNVYVNSEGVFLNCSRGGEGLALRVYNPFYPWWRILTLKVYVFRDFKIGNDSRHYIRSKSGVYHFGVQINPIDGIFYPVLVVDSKTPGIYDTVYVDLSTAYAELVETLASYHLLSPGIRPQPYDLNFYDEEPHRVGDGTEILARDFTGDGVPDISAGLLGARVLDVWGVVGMGVSEQYEELPLAFWGAVNGTLLPGLDPNGNFYGVMQDFYLHGTMAAVSAAGRGVVGYRIYGNETGYRLRGAAPGAKIMAIKVLWWSDILYGWMWASGFEFDNEKNCWNYSGEHRAEIISNSWSVKSMSYLYYAAGYDVISILQDALSIPRYLHPDFPGTIFINSAGNAGYGYGTIGSPSAASFSLSVGASTSSHIYSFISKLFYERIEPRFGGNTSYADDIVDFSSRGPSVVGDVKPDLLNIGTYTFTPGPILLGFGNGSEAFGVFGGTSLSAPLTAGVAALTIQALREAGRAYSPFLVKNILMCTTKDLSNDPFAQGSGRVDALRAVHHALRRSGTFIAYTNATYKNLVEVLNRAIASYNFTRSHVNITALPKQPQPMAKWFAGRVPAGGESSAVFTIYNPSNSTLDVSLKAVYLKLVKKVSINATTKPREYDPLLGDEGGYQPNYFNLTELFGPLPQEDGLLVVKVYYPFTSFYNSTKSPLYGDAISIASLYFYDWDDVNRDGVVWYNETKLVNRAGSYGTIQEVRISDPGRRITHTPLIGVYPVPIYVSIWRGVTRENASAINYTLTIYYYKKAEWNWIKLDRHHLTLKPNSTTEFKATVEVPLDAKPGTYQAYIVVNGSNGQTCNIPFSVVVPVNVEIEDVPHTIAGVRSSNGSLYDNGVVYGAFDFFGSYASGEWRSYVINITNPHVNTMSIRLRWSSPHTSIDIFVIDPSGRLIASSVPAGAFFELFGWPSNDWLGWGVFYPSQNAGPNMTILQAPVNQTGLYTIILHNTLFGGEGDAELLYGELQLSTLLPDTSWPRIDVVEPKLYVSGRLLIPFSYSDDNILSVECSLDGGEYIDILGKRWLAIDTQHLTDGLHTITFRARDTVGHTTTQTISFYTDNTHPSITIFTPTPHTYLSSNTTIKFKVHDANLKKALLSLRDVVVDVSELDSYVWNTRRVEDGVCTIILQAYDKAENYEVAKVPVIIDNTPPTIKLLNPKDKATLHGLVEVVFDVEDENLDKVILEVDGKPQQITPPYHYLWNTTALNDGWHTIKVIAVDKASNTNTATATILTNNIQLSLLEMINRIKLKIIGVKSAPIMSGEAKHLINKAEETLQRAMVSVYEWRYEEARALIAESTSQLTQAITIEAHYTQTILQQTYIISTITIISLATVIAVMVWRRRRAKHPS